MSHVRSYVIIVDTNMEKKDYYKYLFIIGGIWNLILAVPQLLLSFVDGRNFFLEVNLTGEALMFYQIFRLFVIGIGFGYTWVGLNINRNHGIVLLGIIGKILGFTYVLTYFFLSEIELFQVIVGTCDLIWVILFIEFLINYKRLVTWGA